MATTTSTPPSTGITDLPANITKATIQATIQAAREGAEEAANQLVSSIALGGISAFLLTTLVKPTWVSNGKWGPAVGVGGLVGGAAMWYSWKKEK